MTKTDKAKLLKQNTLYWFAAIVLPLIFHFGLANTKFPWPLLLPIMLVAPMLGSNSLLSKATGEGTDEVPPK